MSKSARRRQRASQRAGLRSNSSSTTGASSSGKTLQESFYIELLRRLGPRDEVEPLDGRLPQYRPVFMIDSRPLRKKIRRSPTYGMSAASCRPRRLERNRTPNAGRVPDDDAAIRRFKGLPIFFSFIRYVRSARFAVPLSTKPPPFCFLLLVQRPNHVHT